MDTNRATATTTTKTASTEKTDFEVDNLFTSYRSEVWKPTGWFEITASNNKLYFDDGGAQTATITASATAYTTGTLMATQVQTQMNAVSSGFTVSYSTSTYKFTISHASNFELTITSTTNAIWQTLGFTGSSDLTGANSYTGDAQRNHYPYEWFKLDLGAAAEVGFVGLIGDLSATIQISSTATITVEGNGSDSWASPSLSETLTRTTDGAFNFIDTVASSYRWWRVTIADMDNPLGPEFGVGHAFLGPFQNVTNNIQTGFSFNQIDESVIAKSDGGQIYVDTKTKYYSFAGMGILRVSPSDKQTIENIFKTVGTHTPFYISLDPQGLISNNIGEFTRFVRFVSPPSFQHALYNTFDVNLNVVEVV